MTDMLGLEEDDDEEIPLELGKIFKKENWISEGLNNCGHCELRNELLKRGRRCCFSLRIKISGNL